MRKDFLPFSKPSISEEEIAAVGQVLRSGWITTGPKAVEFEKNFCKYVGCGGAVALTSATAGMHIAFKALGVGEGHGAEDHGHAALRPCHPSGESTQHTAKKITSEDACATLDEVITPSMTWVSTVNITVLAGARPVFVDIDRDTLLVSPEAIKNAITAKTKVIIPVHFAGVPVDMDPIREMAQKKGIALIEDAAHALGTWYKGEHVGKNGTSIFSFHPIKNITTGEGGMFCSDDEKLLDHIRRLKFHGLGVDAFDRTMQGRSPQAEVLEPGYKYNLPDIAAVLGIGQLARVDEFNRKRSEIAAIYQNRLTEIDELLPLAEPSYRIKHAWHLFIVRLDIDKAKMTRDEFMAELKKRNIGTGLHFRAVHLQKYYMEAMGMRRGMLPNTEWNSDRILSLPLFPDMNERDVDDVVSAIKEALKV